VKRFAAGLIGLALLAPSVARANDDVLDAASEARFKEGLAFAKQGKYEQARASFLQTLVLSPRSPNVLLNLAISEHGAGHPVEALGHVKMYLASPKVDAKRAQEVKQTLYDELWRATGHLKIQADRGDPVLLDGDVKLGNAPLADVVDVSTGKHRVASGSRSVDVTVSAGETKDVVLAAEQPAPTAPALQPRPGPDHVSPPAEEPRATIWKPMTFVLGGATLVAGGLALYFNVKSNDASDRASALRAEHAGADCGAPGAPSFCGDITNANNDQDSAASASRVLWIGSGALLAGTVLSGVLWATSGSSSKTGVLAPSVGPRSAGATYRFAF
jgi:tetratricopeptide (TPR) repeat protein